MVQIFVILHLVFVLYLRLLGKIFRLQSRSLFFYFKWVCIAYCMVTLCLSLWEHSSNIGNPLFFRWILFHFGILPQYSHYSLCVLGRLLSLLVHVVRLDIIGHALMIWVISFDICFVKSTFITNVSCFSFIALSLVNEVLCNNLFFFNSTHVSCEMWS